MKILVCDDQKDRCRQIADKVREGGQKDVSELFEKSFTKEIKSLFKSVASCLDGPKKFKFPDKFSFDSADLIILDNNLGHLDVEGARLTAESLAGYIRAFTGAPYIISLNKNLEVDFDLRYLVGDYATRTDLALNMDHLANPALWTRNRADATNTFLPWYWPKLSLVHEQRRAQIEFVRQHLDAPILTALAIPEDANPFLSLHARGALSPSAESDGEVEKGGVPLTQINFRQNFLSRDRSLPAEKERQDLSDAERAGVSAMRNVIARVVAADIDLWFRRDVLGPQDALVDLPHLLLRFPFLLGERAKDINHWNESIASNNPPFCLEPKLYGEFLVKRQYGPNCWVPTPSFWWPNLKADEKLNELFFAAKEGDWADVVFCEDSSTFVERSAKNGTSPKEFSAEFEGSWGRRYVAGIQGIKYAPRSRFAV